MLRWSNLAPTYWQAVSELYDGWVWELEALAHDRFTIKLTDHSDDSHFYKECSDMGSAKQAAQRYEDGIVS